MKTHFCKILQFVSVLAIVLSSANTSHASDWLSTITNVGTELVDSAVKTRNNNFSSATNTQTVKSIQSNLAALGYNPGPADGVFGSGTKNAIQQFERDNNLPVRGEPTKNLLASLEGKAGQGGAMNKIIAAAGGTVFGKVMGKKIEDMTDGAVSANKVAVLGGLIGTQIAVSLSQQDQQHLQKATKTTIATGKSSSWSNPETGVSGETKVTNKETKSESVDIPVMKKRIQEVPPLELIGEDFTVKETTKLYGGPGTDYGVFDEFSIGDTVSVIGKVQGSNWYMVSENGAGSGFVQKNALTATGEAMVSSSPAQASDDIVTKSVSTQLKCKDIKQIVTLADGTEKEENIKACQTPNGWKIV